MNNASSEGAVSSRRRYATPPPGITDISDDDQLICYAARAQLAFLKAGLAGGGPVSNEEVAKVMGMAKPNLAAALRKKLSLAQLRRLDGAILALAPELARTGGLVAFAARLRGREGGEDVSAAIPPLWIGDLLGQQLDSPVGALTQASALLSAIGAAGTESAARLVRDRYATEINAVAKRLILVGVSPPTPHSVAALIMLGSLASHSDEIWRSLDDGLRNGPFGFRIWRGITSIVHASTAGRSPRFIEGLSIWIQRQLKDAMKLRLESLYPARSLDLELAITIPPEWTRKTPDWADEALRTRAGLTSATGRERATAALGLWERAWHRQSAASRVTVKRYLREFASQLREMRDVHRAPDHPAAELHWVADTISYVTEHEEKVCNTWPDTKRQCVEVVRDAARRINVPKIIHPATVTLLEQALLQNAGVYRRRAIDTLRAGGWAGKVTDALAEVLANPDAESWLRCRALFAIGFLQERGESVQVMLRNAYHHVRQQLDASPSAPALIAELHAAVFAVGDCFGVPEAAEEARVMRSDLDPTLYDIASRATGSRHAPIARAAAYTVAVTAGHQDRLLLEGLSQHSDRAAQRVAAWGLKQLR